MNYVPSRNWYYCYNDWDRDSICRDLDAVAALGAGHVRIIVIWPWFQPNPTALSEQHLEYLEQILAIAEERSLDVLVTLYTGWLGGYHFNPPAHPSVRDSRLAVWISERARLICCKRTAVSSFVKRKSLE